MAPSNEDAEGIAEAESEDLVAQAIETAVRSAERARTAGEEGILRRHAVLPVDRIGAIGIDAQDRAEGVAGILAIALGAVAGALVVAGAAVAQGDIEPIVGSEGERPAIVVGLRLRDAEHDAAAGRVDHRGGIAG